MLQAAEQKPSIYEEAIEETGGGISIGELIGVLRRGIWVIIVLTSLFVGLAMFMIKSTLPTYSTSTSLLIDPRELVVLPNEEKQPSNLMKENLIIDSQIEIVKTNDLLRRVMDRLDIMNDPDFMDIGLFDRLKRNIPSSRGEYTERDERSVLSQFKKKISTRRKGLTHVFMISYSSIDAERAALVANTIADEYIKYQLEIKLKTASDANLWLEGRRSELKAKVLEAEKKVEAFRIANDLSDLNNLQVSERKVTELNSQLVNASTQAAEAKARYERIQSFLKGETSDITVKEVLNNSVIIELRRSYAKTRRIIEELGRKFGEQHQTVIDARQRLEQTNALIKQEVERIAETYRSDYEIALSREEFVKSNLQNAKNEANTLSPKLVELEELEREADSARNVYKSILSRYNETVELKELPTNNITVIETAEIPNNPGSPSKTMFLALAIIFGGAGGYGLALLRYIIDNRVWTKADLELATRRGCLGIVPDLQGTFLIARDREFAQAIPQAFNHLATNRTPHSAVIPLNVLRPFHKVIAKKNESTAEVLRNTQLAMRLKDEHMNSSKKGKVIMFASTVTGEGKSFLSIINALHLAHSGARTLLIDADFHNCELTRALTPQSAYGIEELIQTRKLKLSEVITHDQATQLRFLPARNLSRQPSNIDIVVTGVFNEFIDRVRDYFDYIIIDVPPLLSLPDGRGLAAIVDHVIYVGDWGRIEKSAIKRALEHSPELSDKVTGCVVNRVNINKFAKYGEGALIGYPANKAKSKNIPARLRKKLTMLHMLVDKLTRSFIRERRTNLR